jgi:hypothetical protein
MAVVGSGIGDGRTEPPEHPADGVTSEAETNAVALVVAAPEMAAEDHPLTSSPNTHKALVRTASDCF